MLTILSLLNLDPPFILVAPPPIAPDRDPEILVKANKAKLTDAVTILELTPKKYHPRPILLDQLKTVLENDDSGIRIRRFDSNYNLTRLNDTTAFVHTIPAGSIIDFIGCCIINPIHLETGHIAIGILSPSLSIYGKTPNLEELSTFSTLFVPVILLDDTDIYICGVDDSGALLNTNITTGEVRVVLVYREPAVLTTESVPD